MRVNRLIGKRARNADPIQTLVERIPLVLAFIAVAFFLAPLTACAQDKAAPSQSPLGSMLPLFVMFIAIMYFFMIRPNQKRERERRQMLENLAKGDKVVTTGGIVGTIVGLNEKSIILRISDDPVVKMEFLRGAVSQVAGSAGKKDH